MQLLKDKNYDKAKLVILLGLMFFLYAFANRRSEAKNLENLNIEFVSGEPKFLSKRTVNKMLIQNKGDVKNIAKEQLVLNELEVRLRNHPMIKEAQVYLSVNGELECRLEQRTPIARVVGLNSFYIDAEGKSMPLSKEFTARVPLVQGNINKNNLDEVFRLVAFIQKDEFLKKSVIGLRLVNSKFQLQLRQADFVVEVGSVNRLQQKFNNFKAFYKKAKTDKSLKKFERVNLIYKNQVVVTKKD